MKKIPYTEFERLFKPIYRYQRDYSESAEALSILYPESFVTPLLGADLLEHYINLLEGYLELEGDWISWFVFDNECGLKRLEAKTYGDENFSEITCLEDLYNFLTNY